MTGQTPRGHDGIVAGLEELASGAGSIPHAWLFTGPRGVGKATTASWWAARLKCLDPASCNASCASCKQVAAGSHPDLSLLTVPEDKKLIGIESVRKLITDMALKPASVGPRVAIVDQAERMTTPAQSAILKLLEEPPGWTVIMLVTDNPSALLTTVRSRCQRLGFGRPSKPDMLAVLAAHGLDEQAARARLALSGGDLGLALSRDEDTTAQLDALRRRLEGAGQAGADDEALVAELAERRKKDPALDDLLLDWRLDQIREALREGRVAGSGDRTLEALSALGRNANPRLALRALLLGRGR